MKTPARLTLAGLCAIFLSAAAMSSTLPSNCTTTDKDCLTTAKICGDNGGYFTPDKTTTFLKTYPDTAKGSCDLSLPSS